MDMGEYGGGGVKKWVLIGGRGVGGGGRDAVPLYLQYGSKYINYYVIILIVEIIRNCNNNQSKKEIIWQHTLNRLLA